MANIVKYNEKQKAVEIYATTPNITIEEVANTLNVHRQTVMAWRRDPNFIDAIYNRYMVEFGGELPAVLTAMIREAKAGNVQAGRLVLEHSGKLVKNINITIDSPFEKFLKADKTEVEYEDGEIQDIVDGIPEPQHIVLPERNKESEKVRTENEFKGIKAAIKNDKRKHTRNQMTDWKRRARDVGVEYLPDGRPSKGAKEDWINKIKEKEESLRNKSN
jgi:hypothetical protein